MSTIQQHALFARIDRPELNSQLPAASTYQVTIPQLEHTTSVRLAKMVLVTQAVLAILANLPVLRGVVLLVQKSISLIASIGFSGYTATHKPKLVDVAFAVGAIALGALGLASVIATAPLLLVIATVAESVIQFASAVRCFAKETRYMKQGIIHLLYGITAALTAASLLSSCFTIALVAVAISLAVTTVLVAKSIYEKKPIEALSYAVMAGAQSWSLSTQIQQLMTYNRQKSAQEDVRRKWQEMLLSLKDKKTATGFQEQWQFPSDHLPVGYEQNGVRIVSWNVCNSNTTSFLPGMGLDKSLIGTQDVLVPGGIPELTVRDQTVGTIFSELAQSGDVIALQECSGAFVEHLRTLLPENYQMVIPDAGYKDDFNITIYNTQKLQLESSGAAFAYANSTPDRTVTTTVFDKLVLVNAHVPGSPTLPGLADLTNYVQTQVAQFGNERPVMSVGDNNFGPWEAPQLDGLYPIPTHKSQGGIKMHERDTAYLDWALTNRPVRPMKPDELLPGLSSTVGLMDR